MKDAAAIAVLITGVSNQSTGHQVYKALRLGRRRYRIAVANTALEPLVVVKDADQAVLLPPAGDPGYIQALASAAHATGARFIIPGCDPELLRIVRDAGELAQLTDAVPLVNSQATVGICTDRLATAEAVARAGLRVPVSVDCPSDEAAAAAVEDGTLRYPVIVKPKRGGGGSANVYVAQDAEELRFFAGYVMRSGTTALLQEYVGGPDTEYTISVLSFPDGTIAGSFALRRELSDILSTRLRVANRTGRRELGPSLVVSSGFTQGHVDDFPDVRAAARRIAAAVASVGPINVQGRLVGSEFLVFEINPRFSGTTAMRAMAGYNEPEALIDWHLGAAPTLATYRAPKCRFTRGLAEYRHAPMNEGTEAGAPVPSPA